MKTFLVVTTVANAVTDVQSFTDRFAQEEHFAMEVEGYGVTTTDKDFKDGYIELECGTRITLADSAN